MLLFFPLRMFHHFSRTRIVTIYNINNKSYRYIWLNENASEKYKKAAIKDRFYLPKV